LDKITRPFPSFVGCRFSFVYFPLWLDFILKSFDPHLRHLVALNAFLALQSMQIFMRKSLASASANLAISFVSFLFLFTYPAPA